MVLYPWFCQLRFHDGSASKFRLFAQMREVQHRDSRPLHDLIFKGGNREWPLPTVRLRYVDPSGRQGPIRCSMEPRVQVREIAIKGRLVCSPRQPVHAGCGILLEFEKRRFEVFSADVVQERGELLLLPLSGYESLRGSTAGVYAPLPTLRCRPQGRPRTARG